jgi:fluoride ion exporter CrcB/FEX
LKLAPKIVWLTFLGGAIGSLSRWSIGELSDSQLSLWLVNLIGAFLVGIFNGFEYFKPESRRAFWSTGFAGGLTTMSGVAILLLTPTFDVAAIALMIFLSLLCYWLAVKTSTLVSAKWKA